MKSLNQKSTASPARQKRRNPWLDDVASGQKLVIYGILVYFLTGGLSVAVGPLAFFLFPVAMVMGWLGIYRITRGLDYPIWMRILLMLAMFIPLVSLIVLLFLNSQATGKLRDAGYSVGLAGARDY